MMRTGQLRNAVTIQKPTGTVDAGGHLDLSISGGWATHATRKAKIEPVTGSEGQHGTQIEANITHMVTLHYDTLTATTLPRMRVLYGTRALNIEYVRNEREVNGNIVLGCREVQ